jgi:hypothetical protein
MLKRSTLVDPIDPRLRFLCGSAFFGLGAWWSWRLSKLKSAQPGWTRMAGLLAIPIFAIFIGTYFARAAVGFVAFAGLNPPVTTEEAHVTDFRYGRYGGYFATASLGPGAREFEMKISSELYDALDPWRQPGRDCIVIRVQTGRAGIRRTMLPNLLFDEPISLDHYRNCSGRPSDR